MVTSTFGTVKKYHKNEIIFQEGDPGTHGFLIKSGEVTIFRIFGLKKKILNVLLPGEVFGEMGVINQAPRSADAVASDDCELVVIDKNTFLRALNESPKLIQSITHTLMKRLMILTEMVSGNENQEAATEQQFIRICKLLHWVNKYADPAAGMSFDYDEFCDNAMDIIGVSRLEIYNMLEKLSLLKLLEILGDLNEKSKSRIKIVKPDDFLKQAQRAFESLPEKSPSTKNK